MKVLLQDSLNPKLPLKDLLTGIFQAEASGLTVLKFTVEEKERGLLYFLGGHYIVYAALNESTAVGMPALNELLQLTKADFVYETCDSFDALPKDDNLKIEVKKLIETWQEPAKVSGDELLDKIFNTGPAPGASQANISALQQEVHITPLQQTVEADTTPSDAVDTHENVVAAAGDAGTKPSSKRKDVDWDLVEPLISTGAPGPEGVGWGTGGSWTAGPNIEVDPHAAQELRALSTGFQWRRGVHALAMILIALMIIGIVIACCLWLLMKAPSARLGPRRYAIPVEKRNFYRTP